MFFWAVSLFFWIGFLCAIVSMHYSVKFVREIKCYKNWFVLSSCFDERAFSFDKVNRPEKSLVYLSVATQ